MKPKRKKTLPGMGAMDRMTIRIEPQLRGQLENIARKVDVDLSEVVRLSCERMVKNVGRQRIGWLKNWIRERRTAKEAGTKKLFIISDQFTEEEVETSFM